MESLIYRSARSRTGFALLAALIGSLLTGCCFSSDRKGPEPLFTISSEPVNPPPLLELQTLAVYERIELPEQILALEDSVIIYSSKGNFARVSLGGEVQWSVPSGWPIKEGLVVYPSCLAASEDGTRFAIALSSAEGGVEIRSTADGQVIAKPEPNPGSVAHVAFDTAVSGRVWLRKGNGDIERWRIEGQALTRVDQVGSIPSKYIYLSSLLAIPERREMIAIDMGHARVWDSETLSLKREFKGDWIDADVQRARGDARLVSLRSARTRGWVNLAVSARMTVWSIEDGRPEVTIEGWRKTKDNAANIRGALLVGPHSLATWDDRHLRLIDLNSGAIIGEDRSNTSMIVAAFPNAGTFVATVRPESGWPLRLVVYKVPDR